MNNFVFVTGGAGYIGSHACKSLKALGYVPVTLDNLSTGHLASVKFGPFEHVDLRDKDKIDTIFRKYNPSMVLHFAGLSQVGESVNEPESYWRNNVIGTLNLIESAAANKCRNFVFSSTCATYGDHDGVLLKENTYQKPNNPYGSSKLAAEVLIAQIASARDLNCAIFRYFNVAGADPDGEIGEVHDPETHLIPIILEAMIGAREEVTIFGIDYNTPDGTCIRDYVHVCDLVDAHIMGLLKLGKSFKFETFNLGTGHGFSVREVVGTAKLITNMPIKIIEGKKRPGDCAVLVSGSQLAKEKLGWTPQRSDLKQMINDAWKWRRSSNFKYFLSKDN